MVAELRKQAFKKAFKKAAQWTTWAYTFFVATKDVPKFQEQYRKVGLTSPAKEDSGPSFTSNHSDTTFATATTNTTFNQNNFSSTFINNAAQVEKAVSFIDWLISAAPTIGAYSNLLSLTNQVLTGQQAIAELRKMNEHLGKSAAAAWGEFTFGDKFPQHVYEFVLNEMRSPQESMTENKKQISECFFVFNSGDSWWPKFSQLCHEKPLPEGFFGCFTNLDVLIALIRDVLRPAMGLEMKFTVLMPVAKLTILAEPVMLPRGIGPLRLKGELTDEACSVYINLCKVEEETVLDGINNLCTNITDNWRELAIGGAFFGTGVPYAFACMALAPIPVVGIPLAMVSWIGGGPVIVSSAMQAMNRNWTVEVRVLGSEEKHLYDVTNLE